MKIKLENNDEVLINNAVRIKNHACYYFDDINNLDDLQYFEDYNILIDE